MEPRNGTHEDQDTAPSAAHAAPDRAPAPGTAPAAGSPAAALHAALAASPGSAVAVIADAAGTGKPAARAALLEMEKAGTAARIKGAKPGIPDTWTLVGPAPDAAGPAADPQAGQAGQPGDDPAGSPGGDPAGSPGGATEDETADAATTPRPKPPLRPPRRRRSPGRATAPLKIATRTPSRASRTTRPLRAATRTTATLRTTRTPRRTPATCRTRPSSRA